MYTSISIYLYQIAFYRILVTLYDSKPYVSYLHSLMLWPSSPRHYHLSHFRRI
nr:MAG TPA: hypothetical protein [Caudoviricetes sp.]